MSWKVCTDSDSAIDPIKEDTHSHRKTPQKKDTAYTRTVRSLGLPRQKQFDWLMRRRRVAIRRRHLHRILTGQPVTEKSEEENQNYEEQLLLGKEIRKNPTVENIFHWIGSLNLIDDTTGKLKRFAVNSRVRSWTLEIGHTLPTAEALRKVMTALPASGKGISIGCGVACWERLIELASHHKISIDTVDTGEHALCEADRIFKPVTLMRCEEIDWSRSNGYDILFVGWSLPDPWRYDAYSLQRFHGRYVIWIGEHRGVGVGSVAFRRTLNCSNQWRVKVRIDLPSCRKSNGKEYAPFIAVYERVQQRTRQQRPHNSAKSSVAVNVVMSTEISSSLETRRFKDRKHMRKPAKRQSRHHNGFRGR